MTIEQFNKLTVNTLVRISAKGRNVPTAWGAAYRINRSLKTIKPFGSKRWYSYRHVSIDHQKYASGYIWGICGSTYTVEAVLTPSELERL